MKEPKTTMRIIKVKDLEVHPVAQRDLRESKIVEFMQNINLDAIGMIHAVRRSENDGAKLYVVDGQHRIETLRRAGLLDYEVSVCVHAEVKDDAAAARLFLDLNNRSPVTSYDRFKNELTAGDAIAVKAFEAVQKHGMRIGPVPSSSVVSCVGALRRLAEWGVADEAIGLARGAWGKTADSHEGKVLEGIGMLLRSFNGELDRGNLQRKLSKYAGGPCRLLGDAKSRLAYEKVSLTRSVALTILAEYNKGKSASRLQFSKRER